MGTCCANPAKGCPHALHGNVVCLYITMEASSVLRVESAQQHPGNPQSLTFRGSCINGKSSLCGPAPVAPALGASPLSSDQVPALLNPCSCTELPGLFCVRSAVRDLRTLWCTQTPLLLQVTQSTSSHIQHLPYVCWGHPVSFYAPAALQQAIKYLAIDFIRSFPFPETRAGSDH